MSDEEARDIAKPLIVLAALAFAAPAQAGMIQGEIVERAPAALGVCWETTARIAKRNKVGMVLYRVRLPLYWCGNASRLTYASVPKLAFSWVAWWCCDVIERTSPLSRYEYGRRRYHAIREAHVRSCLPWRAICKHYYPWIEVSLRRYGKAFWGWSNG
jgi:hypothetical protein